MRRVNDSNRNNHENKVVALRGRHGLSIPEKIVATIVLIAALCMSAVLIAQGIEEMSRAEEESYYRQMEKNLVADTRAFLAQEGYADSGVVLNRVVDESGMREYKLIIHHGEIDAMEEYEREELAQRIAALYFEDEKCEFRHEFLFYN